MPSISKKQADFMRAVAHSPGFAKKVGVPQSVGKEFNQADKGRKFAKGGDMAESKAMMRKEVGFMKKAGAPKSMVKHEEAEMKSKKMANGGDVSIMPVRNMPAQSNKGGALRGLERAAAMSGRTMPGRMTTMAMAKGGYTKAADGIAKKGKTQGAMVKMAKGGRSC